MVHDSCDRWLSVGSVVISCMERGEREEGSYDTSTCHLKGHEKSCVTCCYGGIASEKYAYRHVTKVVNLYERVKI